MKKLAIGLLLAGSTLGLWAQAPTVTTDTRYARGATQAFFRGTFKANGSNTISQRGICYSSENTEPTIDDSKNNGTFTNSGIIFRLTDLIPGSKYYARAYAICKDGTVGYGETIKFYTLPKGNITWGYDNGGNADENARINEAVGSCVDYWNNLTNITGLYLNVHYGAQTPTADCSYGGWMRVGPNASYQRTGTIMHEALHAIGVGTTDLWYGSTSPLRAGSGTGEWLGTRATELIRFWDNNTTGTLKGDGTHLWPYGINGAHEDDGTEKLYTINSLIAQAVGEDGLPCTYERSFGSPHYAFPCDDDVKYYIKNEHTNFGFYTSYLVETNDHKLKWEELSADQAVANDAAAWYFSFDPTKQYYQLRNAATGYYITYTGSGTSGIFTKQISETTSAQDFHLLRSRIDVTGSDGNKVTDAHSYWMIHPNNATSTPPALVAVANGNLSTTGFNLANNAKSQRWLILTQAEALALDQNGLSASKSTFNALDTKLQALLATPHAEISAGTDNDFSQKLSEVEALVSTAVSPSQFDTYIEQLTSAAKTWLAQVYATNTDQPFEVSFLLKNPSMESNTEGWTISAGSTFDCHEAEFYENLCNVTQTPTSMPVGTYILKAKAFQRPGSYADVYADYTAGTDNVGGRLYLENSSKYYVKVKNIMADRSATKLHADDKQMADGTWIPNTMASAEAHFNEGYYENIVEHYLATAGNMKLGLIAANNVGTACWIVFTNFRLYSLGAATREEIEAGSGIQAINTETNVSEAIYNLNGQRIDNGSMGTTQPAAAGFYLKGRRIILVR